MNIALEINEVAPDPETLDPEIHEKPYMPLAYYKLRLTLVEEIPDEETIKTWLSPKRLARRAQPYVDKLISMYSIDKSRYTAVVELLDKRGNYTKPHLHLHFIANAVKAKHEAVLRCLKREYLKITDEILKGNTLYSLVLETYIDDDRFFRYPFKQLESLDNPLNLTPKTAHENAEALRQVANAQWKIGCEVANTKNARHEPAEDRYTRMTKYLEKNNYNTNLQKIALGITRFYQKENSAINRQTIQGYTITYALQIKILDDEIFAKNIADEIQKFHKR